MASERMQKRIEALLDEADAAVSAGEWIKVAQKARAVLAIDAANEDAAAFLKMAAANGALRGPEQQTSVPAGRFDKFTKRARVALTLAQEEAYRFNHNYIGTEHIRLGLVRDVDGTAERYWRRSGRNHTRHVRGSSSLLLEAASTRYRARSV